ncbi:MAG: biotin transporter BioY [Candidatus Pacebacteria bacterium]|nr:biotin transporter BioY [Candidatus Paceibacterota bacterium]
MIESMPYKPKFIQQSRLSQRLWLILLTLAGSGFLALSAQVAIPMVPVPLTLQTLGLLILGVTLGWRVGGLSVLAYLAEGAMGLPVFANGSGGAHLFVGPTAGYLLGFPLVTIIAGWTSEKLMPRLRANRSFIHGLGLASLVWIGFTVAQTACLLLGGAWLAVLLNSTDKAWQFGIQPFLIGEVIKSTLALFALQAAVRLQR